jgi:decaprenyl-diphosphate synthase subunit 2
MKDKPPVLFHLEHDPTLYDEIKNGVESVNNINYQKIHAAVLNGPGIEKTKELQSKHSMHAMTELYKFPPSDARKALENIIMAMQEN